MPTAKVRDVELFHTIDGAGDTTVLLIHGLGCDSDDWAWQLDPLSERYRVVAPDLRGHGRSTASVSGYAPPELAADIAALVEELATGPVVAVGHSMGGVVASALAVEHPELVSAVVTVDPAYGIEPADMAGLDAVSAGLDSAAGRDALLALIAGVEGTETPPFQRELHRRNVQRTPLRVLRGSFAGLWAEPARFGQADVAGAYLRRRRCPVLAVYADPVRAAWDESTFTTSGSRAVSWPGVGHWLHQERPAEFNALLLDWLAATPG